MAHTPHVTSDAEHRASAQQHGQLAALVPAQLRETLLGRTLVVARPVFGRDQGRHRSRRAGVGLDFRDHRPYVPGDDPRRVDWRAVARHERLVLRQTEAEDQLALAILLDAGANMVYGDGNSRKLSVAKAIAAGMAWLGSRQSDPVGLALGGNDRVDVELCRPTSNRDRLAALAQKLYSAHGRGNTDWNALIAQVGPRLRKQSVVLVISDFFDPGGAGNPEDDAAQLRGLAHLKARGHDVVLVQVAHADELGFPWEGDNMLRFVDPRAQHPTVEGAGAVWHDGYLDSLKAHQQRLGATCEASGLVLETMCTRDPLPDLFVRLLARLAGTPALGDTR